jgi:hypothetical protein
MTNPNIGNSVENGAEAEWDKRGSCSCGSDRFEDIFYCCFEPIDECGLATCPDYEERCRPLLKIKCKNCGKISDPE